jgi:3-isopropylmalate/(R)-2-methylmalate dehydratase small subunit
MKFDIKGRARLLGDDINTDYIVSSSRKKETLDPAVLRRYLLETLDRTFAASVAPGDLLVAGKNFGCGSAMEVAVTAVLAAGIKVVIARGFSRTYFRNAINNGLIPIECDTTAIGEGDQLRVELDAGQVRVTDLTRGIGINGIPLSGITLAILHAGGLVPYFRTHHEYVETPDGEGKSRTRTQGGSSR